VPLASEPPDRCAPAQRQAQPFDQRYPARDGWIDLRLLRRAWLRASCYIRCDRSRENAAAQGDAPVQSLAAAEYAALRAGRAAVTRDFPAHLHRLFRHEPSLLRRIFFAPCLLEGLRHRTSRALLVGAAAPPRQQPRTAQRRCSAGTGEPPRQQMERAHMLCWQSTAEVIAPYTVAVANTAGDKPDTTRRACLKKHAVL
jgi:hypothetical protein